MHEEPISDLLRAYREAILQHEESRQALEEYRTAILLKVHTLIERNGTLSSELTSAVLELEQLRGKAE